MNIFTGRGGGTPFPLNLLLTYQGLKKFAHVMLDYTRIMVMLSTKLVKVTVGMYKA